MPALFMSATSVSETTRTPLGHFFERLIEDRMTPAARLPQADGTPSAAHLARAAARESASFR
jgi:hypothetical protein